MKNYFNFPFRHSTQAKPASIPRKAGRFAIWSVVAACSIQATSFVIDVVPMIYRAEGQEFSTFDDYQKCRSVAHRADGADESPEQLEQAALCFTGAASLPAAASANSLEIQNMLHKSEGLLDKAIPGSVVHKWRSEGMLATPSAGNAIGAILAMGLISTAQQSHIAAGNFQAAQRLAASARELAKQAYPQLIHEFSKLDSLDGDISLFIWASHNVLGTREQLFSRNTDRIRLTFLKSFWRTQYPDKYYAATKSMIEDKKSGSYEQLQSRAVQWASTVEPKSSRRMQWVEQASNIAR